ncbi:MAG: FecR domain-containing protein [Pseudolabrys sp.]
MKRREFFAFFVGVVSWPFTARAQTQSGAGQVPGQVADDALGQIATLQGGATVTRAKAAAAALKISDAVYKNDVLQTGANAALGVTFDDETTLSLSANARIVSDEFVYEKGAKGKFNIARGTVAFVASLVAKTGDMTITTPTSTLGIRGTTGVVDVPDSAAPGSAGEAKIRLYPDADGRVGRIDVFSRQGERLGALTQGASAFAIRPGAGGRFAAVPFQIPPQEAARVTQCRAPDDLATPATARTKSAAAEPATEPAAEPAAAESAWATGRSAAAEFESPAEGQPDRAAARRRSAGERLKKLNPFAPKRPDQLPR